MFIECILSRIYALNLKNFHPKMLRFNLVFMNFLKYSHIRLKNLTQLLPGPFQRKKISIPNAESMPKLKPDEM